MSKRTGPVPPGKTRGILMEIAAVLCNHDLSIPEGILMLKSLELILTDELQKKKDTVSIEMLAKFTSEAKATFKPSSAID